MDMHIEDRWESRSGLYLYWNCILWLINSLVLLLLRQTYGVQSPLSWVRKRIVNCAFFGIGRWNKSLGPCRDLGELRLNNLRSVYDSLSNSSRPTLNLVKSCKPRIVRACWKNNNTLLIKQEMVKEGEQVIGVSSWWLDVWNSWT